jgi:hypothetical protein
MRRLGLTVAAMLSACAVLPHAVSADHPPGDASESCSRQPVHQRILAVSVDGQRTWIDTAQARDTLLLCVGVQGPLVSWGVRVSVPT